MTKVRSNMACLVCAAVLILVRPDSTYAAPVPSAHPLPVIIDTDVGDDIDDAFALAIALQDPRLRVLGITTAWGDTRTRVLLVRRLLATLGRRGVTVAQGPATADAAPFTQRQWALRATDISPAPDAIEFIREEVRKYPGEITLVAIAPLSNIEALYRRDPDALRWLRQVVMMGGSIHAGYNLGGAIPVAQPSAEYNVAADPRGLVALLKSGVRVRMFPLDSTQIKFDEVRRERLFAYGSAASDALTLLYHQWRLLNTWGALTPTLFDVVPIAWLLQPSSCPLAPMRIAVDERGYTRPTVGNPNIDVCLSVDKSAVQRLIIDTLAPYPRRSGVPARSMRRTSGGATPLR